ncbi:hypothetical protein H0H93_001867 [Arthromyces matolae]|nr:hypothetical protein H0H93_001867 [Arthromyces matolae]
MLFVERYYLRKYNASFSENFYGLKRRRRPYIETPRAQAAVGGVPPGEALGQREIGRSLFFLVGIPYLRAKAQDYYEELGGGLSADVLDENIGTRQMQALTENTIKGRLKRGFKATYPYLNLSYEVWLLLYNMAYLFDRSPFYRPWLSWMGIDLRRLGSEDFRAAALMAQKKLSPDKRRGVLSWLRFAFASSPHILLDSLRLLLPAAIFFVKFLEWWYSPGSPARSLSTPVLGPAVPPPQMLPPHPQGIPFDRDSYGTCPICQGTINNATALPSGYVFCYRCAYDQVEKHGKCPVTLLPARVWQLRKVLFGKHILAQQVPGWSSYYLDYKFLKKIISSLAANRPASDAAALASGVRPTDVLAQSPSGTPSHSPSGILDHGLRRPPIFSASSQDTERGPDFRAHKAAFFFRLERELEKINDFYLQKEAELKLRMETLLSKRRAAAMRGLPDTPGTDITQNNVEWSAVEEGFRLLERDVGKLQQFIEVNATGFRKILKKFDKRSKSTTKELYLSRQLISELSDTIAICLLDLTDLSSGLKFEGPAANDIFAQQILAERTPPMGPFRDLENNLRSAVATRDTRAIAECAKYSDALSESAGGKPTVTRILWNRIIDAPPDLADLIFSSLKSPFDFQFVDDINGRTCLHEAAMAGVLSLVELCLEKGVSVGKTDLYGRTALHYASMNGHPNVCRRLLQAKSSPTVLDRDNYSPLVYATMKGMVECVRVLLDEGKVPAERTTPLDDQIPLSLASQFGHVDVVVLLLQYGARSLPNSNGEYPMHLAAREGHADVCKLLRNLDGWDTPDKYHEWTPLFHAARYGQDSCVQTLLEAGARLYATDELGHRAVSGVRLHHRLISPVFEDEYLLASAPLKLVMTSRHNVNSAPYTVSLPQRDEGGVFAFQINPLKILTLEFSIYPNFGTKTIGRAVALPSLFRDLKNNNAFTLPILDTRLHVVGEVSKWCYQLTIKQHILTREKVDFEINIITPFEGVTLDFGGEVETYWKSMVAPPSIAQPETPKWPHRSNLIGSAQASPSVHSVTNDGSQSVTISSLQGPYIYATVQVTRDLHPVIYSEWLLPSADIELGVSDVTLAQFESLARHAGKNAPSGISTMAEWSSKLPGLMLSVAEFLKLLPVGVNVCLELAYPARATRKKLSLGHVLELNEFVESVLRNIYHASASLDAPYTRRKISFASFSPDKTSSVPSPTALGAEEENDPRLSSIGTAVEFARTNNLLGVLVDAELLVQVPSLLHGIRNAGLIVGAHGKTEDLNSLFGVSDIEGTPVDAILNDGQVVFTDHEMEELI